MELPKQNSPEVFGLHSNAEIGYFTNATKSLWVDLISMRTTAASAGGGISKDEYLHSIIEDIQSKLPTLYDLFELRKQFGENLMPTQVVLLQEIERFNLLIKRMEDTLFNLARALRGEIGMSNELDELSFSLVNGFLPSSWRRLTAQTEKPLSAWIDFFIRRDRLYRCLLYTSPSPRDS